MKNLLNASLLFGMLFTIKVNAQNYSPIVNGNTSLFNLDESIKALHVDSIKADPKGVAYYFLKPFDQKDQTNSYCYDFVPAWSGSKMIAAGNTYYFFNKNEDTIKILPLNEIDVPWVFYKYSNGDYIEAKTTLKEQLSFLNLTDSVKTISLQRKTAANLNIDDPVNTSIIQISKQYGFVKMISFSILPDSYPSSKLAGLSLPEAGQQLLTPQRIYDFNINDEFHYKTNYFNVPISGYSDKIIRKVIGKYTSLNTDTVIYTFQQRKETINYTVINGGMNTVASPPVYQVNTFDEKYIFSDTTIYPGVYLSTNNTYSDPTSYELGQSLANGSKLLLSINHMSGVSYSEEEDCWTQIVDGPADYISYLEGCGYYEINRDVFPSSDNSKLVYYKKGADAYGEALILSNVIQASSQALVLFPNPLKQGEHLHISTDNFDPIQITIYNGTGNKVLESFNNDVVIESLDVSKLQPGLYIVQLMDKKNKYTTSKLIIK